MHPHEQKDHDLSDPISHVISFNINGLKPALRRTFAPSLQAYLETFIDVYAQIVCLQEVKLTQRDLHQDLCRLDNWECYYCLCRSSETKATGGYSGTAVFLRKSIAPFDARHGLAWSVQVLQGLVESLDVTWQNSLKRMTGSMKPLLSWMSTNIIAGSTGYNSQRKPSVSVIGSLTAVDAFVQALNDVVFAETTSSFSSALMTMVKSLELCAQLLDDEGRVITVHCGNCIVVNLYAPALQYDQDKFLDRKRLVLKCAFHCALHVCVKLLSVLSSDKSLPKTNGERTISTSNSEVTRVPCIVVGDFNLQLDADTDNAKDIDPSIRILPFADQTRCMMADCNLVDSFVHFNPNAEERYTCWNQATGAKVTNTGSRIDMILVHSSLLSSETVVGGDIHFHCSERSDHCPVSIAYKAHELFQCRKDTDCIPPLCATLTKESNLRQKTLLETLKLNAKSADLRAADLMHRLGPPKEVLIAEETPMMLETELKRLLDQYCLCLLVDNLATDTTNAPGIQITDFKSVAVVNSTPQQWHFTRNVLLQTQTKFVHHLFCSRPHLLVHCAKIFVPQLSGSKLTEATRFPTTLRPLVFEKTLGRLGASIALLAVHIVFYVIHMFGSRKPLPPSQRPVKEGFSANQAYGFLSNGQPPKKRSKVLDHGNQEKATISESKDIPESCRQGYQKCQRIVKSFARWSFSETSAASLITFLLQSEHLHQIVSNMTGYSVEDIPLSLANALRTIDPNLESVFSQIKIIRKSAAGSSILPTQSQDPTVEHADLLRHIAFLSQKEQQAYLATADFAPLCQGHRWQFLSHLTVECRLPCVQRKVKKDGKSFGRLFWSCVLPQGKTHDPSARCNTFIWVSKMK